MATDVCACKLMPYIKTVDSNGRWRARADGSIADTPSAKTPSRDILFLLLTRRRKPAERGHSRQIVRTMRTGWRAHFGPFAVSLAPLSPKQPNHGRFGTVVRSLPDQWVMRCQLGRGFESAALRRSEQGSNHSIRYGCRGDKDRAPRGVAGADRRGGGRAGLARLTVRIGHLNQSRSPATTSRPSRSGSPRSSTTMAARLASSARRPPARREAASNLLAAGACVGTIMG